MEGQMPAQMPTQTQRMATQAVCMQNVRRLATAHQLSRFKKVFVEPFFLLGAEVCEAGSGSGSAERRLHFTISGATQNAYDVYVHADGRIRCSCMDAATHCARLGCACKHTYFLGYRVMRLERATFVTDGRLLPEELQAASDSIARGTFWEQGAGRRPDVREALSPTDVDRLCEGMARVTVARAAAPPDFSRVLRDVLPGDECPVCYDALSTSGRRLVGCPDCGNGVHAECIGRWLARAPRATCVYCRSAVWTAYKPGA
jgi:hypothetical protein